MNSTETHTGKLVCPEPGCDYRCNDPRGMGRHRQAAHGVPGKSPAARQYHKLREANGTMLSRNSRKTLSEKAYERKAQRAREYREANRERLRIINRERYRAKRRAAGFIVNEQKAKSNRMGAAKRFGRVFVEGAQRQPRPMPAHQSLDSVLNYCPSCGANIRKMEMALKGGVLV